MVLVGLVIAYAQFGCLVVAKQAFCRVGKILRVEYRVLMSHYSVLCLIYRRVSRDHTVTSK